MTGINSGHLFSGDTKGPILRCPPYRETKKMTDERQGPTPGVRFREAIAFWRVKENDCRMKENN